jgi:acetyl-CoA C-acetyltransferase
MPPTLATHEGALAMAEAYIVAAARTAGGRKGGRLSGWHPADLAGEVLNSLVDRAGIDPAAVEDVVLGCVGQAGEQSVNIARNAVLASKLPESVPGTSVDRQCGSSQQALHFAAQAVMSGAMDVVIASGVESMSRVPWARPPCSRSRPAWASTSRRGWRIATPTSSSASSPAPR